MTGNHKHTPAILTPVTFATSKDVSEKSVKLAYQRLIKLATELLSENRMMFCPARVQPSLKEIVSIKLQGAHDALELFYSYEEQKKAIREAMLDWGAEILSSHKQKKMQPHKKLSGKQKSVALKMLEEKVLNNQKETTNDWNQRFLELFVKDWKDLKRIERKFFA